jgi:predicted extracellular nuclease
MIRTNHKVAPSGVICSLVLIVLAFAGTAAAQKEVAIAAVQGTKNMSPVEGESVRVKGVVTARIKTGFFLQTPDDQADADPLTSEAIFVFTRTEPDEKAAVGAIAEVTGKVEEFRRNNEPTSLTITELVFDSLRVISTGAALPKPVSISVDDLKPNATDQLERFEGMRVHIAELSVIAPTKGRVDIKTASSEPDGTFYGVLKGIARPFREPGMDIGDALLFNEITKGQLKVDFPKMPIFDGNPERIRIESASQNGTKGINVITGMTVKDLTGVLHYSYRTNTLLVDPDAKHSFSGGFKPKSLPAAGPREFSIAGMNLENFFDDRDDPDYKEDVLSSDAFEKRLKKISLAIRDSLKLPDVIGVVEAENLNGLKALAKRINADAVAAGLSDPAYEAFLIDGNDGRGIDNGFLVKTSRVKVLKVEQLGKDDKYKHPVTGESIFLNDRPPLLIRASIADEKSGKLFEFTAIVNHMKSYLGYDDPRQMQNVRLKKKLQAEFLAALVQSRQKADPADRMILLGDFNSYQFNDGILDMIGTLKGKPAARESLVHYSEDVVDPDLINLVEVIAAPERYSYSFEGNAQVLDHMLISETLKHHVRGFGFARINSDYPEIFRNDTARPERFSDHDPAVAYFSLDKR